MKKQKLLISLFALITLGLGLCFSQPKMSYARAEEQIVEVVGEETEEPIIDEEVKEEEIVDETGEKEEEKDIVTVVKSEIEEIKDTIVAVLNQPIVIGGVSVTVGALVLWAISKLISSAKTKKIKDLIKSINEYRKQMSNSVSKQDYNTVVQAYNNLLPVLKELGTNVKNINVKENVNQLLLECKPIALDCKDFAKEELDKVVEDTKAFTKEEIGKSSIANILNKD